MKDLEEKIKKMDSFELVATFQYVAGLFAHKQEQMSPDLEEIATDLNLLKDEILSRLNIKEPRSKIFM